MFRKLVAISFVLCQVAAPAALAGVDERYIFRAKPVVFAGDAVSPSGGFVAENVAGSSELLAVQGKEPRLVISLFDTEDGTPYQGDVVWELVSGTLPPGISAEVSSDGTLAFRGIATEAGNFGDIVYRVSDGAGNTVVTKPIRFQVHALGDLWLNVMPDEPSETWTGLGNAYVRVTARNLPYGTTLSSANWNIEGDLPEGVATSFGDYYVEFAGPIQVAGNYSARVTLTDSLGRTATANARFKGVLDWVAINSADTVYADTDVDVVTAQTRIREAFSQNTYGQTLNWTLVSGELPRGVTATPSYYGMDYSGTPTEAGDFSVVWLVEDEDGNRLRTDPIRFVVGQSPPMTLVSDRGERVVLNTLHEKAVTISAKDAFKGVPIGEGNWAISGDLPEGMRFEHDGTRSYLRGIPSVAGVFNVTVTATDASGTVDDIVLTLEAVSGLELRQPGAVAVTLKQMTEEFSDSVTLWDIIEDRAYENPAVGWEMISGSLPAGVTATVSANGSRVTYSGIPSESGTFRNIVWRVTDVSGNSYESLPLTISVVEQKAMTLARSGASRARTVVGMPYDPRYIRITASDFAEGGVAEDGWTVTGVPEGMTVTKTASAVTITGIPKLAGDYLLKVSAVDSVGQTASGEYPLEVENGLSYAHYNAAAETISQFGDKPKTGLVALNTTANAPHWNGGLVWTHVSGLLPPGISLAPDADGSVMRFEGSATQSGTYPDILFRVTDPDGNTFESRPFTFVVKEIQDIALSEEKLRTEITSAVGGFLNTYVNVSNVAATDKLTMDNWTISGVPDGIDATLSSDGKYVNLRGTYSGKGDYVTNFAVTDRFGRTASYQISFKIGAGFEMAGDNRQIILYNYVTHGTAQVTIRDIETKEPYTGGATWEWDTTTAMLPGGVHATVSADGSTLTASGLTTDPANGGWKYTYYNVTLANGVTLRGMVAFVIFDSTLSVSSPYTGSTYVGASYDRTFKVNHFSSGVAPMDVDDITLSDPLPAGLSLSVDGDLVRVSGVPEAMGVHSIGITVTDAFGRTANTAMNLTVNAPFEARLTSSSKTLTALTQNIDTHVFYAPYRASGGGYASGLTWTLETGTFPSDLTISEDPDMPGYWKMKGYTSQAGTFKSTWRATSPAGYQVTTPELTLNIGQRQAMWISTSGMAKSVFAKAGGTFTLGTFQGRNIAYGDQSNVVWSIEGLPDGWTANTTVSEDGILTGTLTIGPTTGVFPVTFRATDAVGATATDVRTFTISAP